MVRLFMLLVTNHHLDSKGKTQVQANFIPQIQELVEKHVKTPSGRNHYDIKFMLSKTACVVCFTWQNFICV